MYCVRKVLEDLWWVGGNDRRLAMFEGVYAVPNGVSYNSYLLLDDKTVLFDTVDPSVSKVFFENIDHVLAGRKLDYLVIHHMEPDHSGTVSEVLLRHPETVIVCNDRIRAMLQQFRGGVAPQNAFHLVKEGDTFETGHHTLTFLSAPMVHWPEVMVSYDLTTRTLFSADAFGTFGAINGALFADEVDFFRDYVDEARRYYCNIVGKYGTQVQALLKKASTVQIDRICPLHGFVWRKNIGEFIDRYIHWSTYTPEEQGVMIAYASVYGGTENAAELLSVRLRERGVKTVMFDVSVTPASDIIAAAFRWSHLVFAAPTYNAGIFVTMENLLHDIVAHNLQNRTVALIENGSWAPTSGKHMRDLLGKLKNVTILDQQLTIRSAMAESQSAQLDALADALCATLPQPQVHASEPGTVDNQAMFALSYGLFVLSAREGERDNACIINTAIQMANKPERISISVIKANYTCGMIERTGVFNLSLLTKEVPFAFFQHFGFQSGAEVDKFADWSDCARSDNGLYYINRYTNAMFSCRVVESYDQGSHRLFIAEITESKLFSNDETVTYDYYRSHIKPAPPKLAPAEKATWVCSVCGYVYEGETLPADFICPLCKHPASDFVKHEAKPAEKRVGFVCTVCGYVYEGADMPDDFICPLCHHPKSDFKPLT